MMIGRQSGLGKGLGALIPPKPNHAVITPPYPPRKMGEGVVVESVSQGSAAGEKATNQTAPPSPSSKPPLPPLSQAGGSEYPSAQSGITVLQVPIEKIQRNPHQPRLHFDHHEMEELIASIKEHGILQPIVVTRRPDGGYELIAGERRLRASTIAGLKTVPAILREASDQQKLELAMIENIQRQDLNPVEEAKAYIRLMDQFHLTQDEIGQKMGKSRSQVANMIRLLQLPKEIQQALIDRKISMSQARTLLSLPSDKDRLEVFQKMMASHVTVREAEESISDRLGRRRAVRDPNVMGAENELRELFRCKVDIKRKPTGQGEIRFRFFSDEEFRTLMNELSEASSPPSP